MANKKITDFIAHGSEGHAAILGLIPDKAAPDGYRLADPTAFGPQATQSYLDEVLRQKIVTLKAGAPPAPQSADRRAPHYAPPMFVPD